MKKIVQTETAAAVEKFLKNGGTITKATSKPAAKKTPAKKAKPAKAKPVSKSPAAKKTATKKSGGAYAGRKLFMIGEDNPRKPGTQGQAAMEIVRKNPGIEYAEYLKKGGGSIHVKWDVAHGFLELK